MREVEEETGLRGELGAELPSTHYTDSRGRPKRVRWWRMEPVAGEFTPTDEVDEIRWLTREEAAELLSYDRDLVLLDARLGRRGEAGREPERGTLANAAA